MLQHILTRPQSLVAAETREDTRRAFQAKMDSIRTELYNFAYRLTGTREDAEDLLQESYFKAYKYFHQLRDRSKFKEWIFQITANQFRNTLKRKKREQVYFVDEFEEAGLVPQQQIDDPDIRAERRDQSDRVKSAIADLDPKMREALVLFELQGFSIEETARILQISPGTVKSRLHYARKRLKTELLSSELGTALELEYAQ
jgi:RNA polymerase sigma-70 factor (ECF subfamily)